MSEEKLSQEEYLECKEQEIPVPDVAELDVLSKDDVRRALLLAPSLLFNHDPRYIEEGFRPKYDAFIEALKALVG